MPLSPIDLDQRILSLSQLLSPIFPQTFTREALQAKLRANEYDIHKAAADLALAATHEGRSWEGSSTGASRSGIGSGSGSGSGRGLMGWLGKLDKIEGGQGKKEKKGKKGVKRGRERQNKSPIGLEVVSLDGSDSDKERSQPKRRKEGFTTDKEAGAPVSATKEDRDSRRKQNGRGIENVVDLDQESEKEGNSTLERELVLISPSGTTASKSETTSSTSKPPRPRPRPRPRNRRCSHSDHSPSSTSQPHVQRGLTEGTAMADGRLTDKGEEDVLKVDPDLEVESDVEIIRKTEDEDAAENGMGRSREANEKGKGKAIDGMDMDGSGLQVRGKISMNENPESPAISCISLDSEEGEEKGMELKETVHPAAEIIASSSTQNTPSIIRPLSPEPPAPIAHPAPLDITPTFPIPPPSLLSLLRPPTLSTHLSPSNSRPNKGKPPLSVPSHRIPHFLPTCTLEKSPLESKMAGALYLCLLEETKLRGGFERPKFYLAGKLVESSHTHRFYRLSEKDGGAKEGGEYWYAGKRENDTPTFPLLLFQAVQIINPFVNNLLRERDLQPRSRRKTLEFDGEWEANVAAVNHYEGSGSSVGWHADQLTHLGPYTTIVSLSLGTPRAFRLRPSASPMDPTLDCFGKALRTYEVRLEHNSLFIMHAGTQEYYKHTVPPKSKSLDLFKPAFDVDQKPIPPHERQGYNSRINVTFRMYRKDFHPLAEPIGMMGRPREGTPWCKCGVPCLLRADQKGKVRGPRNQSGAEASAASTTEDRTVSVLDEEMVFFWMCDGSAVTGALSGCGYFKLLDMRAEGRGPCIGWRAKDNQVVAS